MRKVMLLLVLILPLFVACRDEDDIEKEYRRRTKRIAMVAVVVLGIELTRRMHVAVKNT